MNDLDPIDRRLIAATQAGLPLVEAPYAQVATSLGLTEAQVNRLREEHGIYMVSDSRINIAGLNAKTVPVLAAAIAQVL